MMIRNAVAEAGRKLRKHRCAKDDALREAEAFVAEAAGRDREYLLSHSDAALPTAAQKKLADFVRRRLTHEPFELIVGTAMFFGRPFAVRKGALIPRAATEIVTAFALEKSAALRSPLFVDVGTGSGCIAITLAAERPDARVLATDISPLALRLARHNAASNGVATRISFAQTPFMKKFLPRMRRHDGPLVIVANLPYVPTARYRTLAAEIKKFEPRSALVSGKDGLRHYRALLKECLSLAAEDKSVAIYLELLSGQAAPLSKLIRSARPMAHITPIRADGDRNIVGMEIVFNGTSQTKQAP